MGICHVPCLLVFCKICPSSAVLVPALRHPVHDVSLLPNPCVAVKTQPANQHHTAIHSLPASPHPEWEVGDNLKNVKLACCDKNSLTINVQGNTSNRERKGKRHKDKRGKEKTPNNNKPINSGDTQLLTTC